jgi:2-polyprenyl-6-methoxyphenol hydroxylase-like FAD-dependent oxidoreductase
MTSAIIVGGGLAGCVTAIALQKVGISPTVYEAYDRTSDGVGAFLSFAPNGLDALRTLGLDGAVRGSGFDTPRMALFSGSGRKLVEFANGVRADGTVGQTVRRSDLYGALRDEAVRRGIPFAYGMRLVDAEHTGRGTVQARFADGSRAEADLLVGADGLRSRTRTVLDPAAPSARYVGLLNTGGYVRGVAVDSAPGVLNFVFGRRCFLGYVVAPDGEVWWFANPPSARELTREELASLSTSAWRARLVELFAADAGPAVALVRATEQLFGGWNTYDFPTVPTWHAGRMIIVGDAAHAASPASGQGASMAVEDAVTLAKCLRDLPSIEEAFVAYERLRRPRVERVVAQGKRNGNQKAVGPAGRLLRDHVVMPLFARYLARASQDPMAWIYEHHIDWEEPARSATGGRSRG